MILDFNGVQLSLCSHVSNYQHDLITKYSKVEFLHKTEEVGENKGTNHENSEDHNDFRNPLINTFFVQLGNENRHNQFKA